MHSDPPSPRQRWTLTKDAFDRLLAAFDSDLEEAGNKYLLMRRNLVRYFEGRGFPFAEDHADEAVNRVAKRLCEGEDVRNLNSYAYGVARLLLLEIVKERAKEDNALKELPSLRLIENDPTAIDEDQQRLECLTHCLEQLPADGRQLIVAYYEGDSRSRIVNRRRLTESLGIPNQALRSRAVRLREKLEGCLSICSKKEQ
jgi:RNA polymerase sigma factor (sigma-70 family)